ncbi:MAG: hypothetical protein PF689_07965 [Deltaproteobacteria bacterium]|jgi:hypothetical protein|nr:hypothetical protein [Deltaproteobacteria bacterium]
MTANPSKKASYFYHLDRDNKLCWLGDNWNKFAIENKGGEKVLAENLKGKSLWSQIKDDETRQIYLDLVNKVRKTGNSLRVKAYCDTPALKRELKIIISPLPEDGIRFESIFIKLTPRKRLAILDKDVPRSENFIKICSFCKDIKIKENQWKTTEKAVDHLDLFNQKILPQLTHSICPSCYKNLI